MVGIREARQRATVKRKGIFAAFPSFPGSTLPGNPTPADFVSKRNGAITPSTTPQDMGSKQKARLTRTEQELKKLEQ